MKYFVLYVTWGDTRIDKFYLKGKSYSFMEERIERYSNGCLSTNKFTIYTDNAVYGVLREVPPGEALEIGKNEFALINENRSYDVRDKLY
ncbi:hypothetical protein [Neobacillus sp. YIM B06451]|uniref:hypothetical protein n=1 Tax=Neobacillus sp. YIM B06451 TaxID=3070994 RepID=UPI00292CEDDE|nr:hypothetical protein [Neobacillus sp. YIM B06451]